MDKYAKLNELLKGTGGKQTNAASGPVLFQAKVVKVDKDSCTVSIGGLELSDVRLKAVVNEKTDGVLLVTPTPGSPVLVGSLTGDYNDLAVLSIEQFDKIILGGTSNSGIVKAPDLVDRLNKIEQAITELVTDYKKHVHPTSSPGSPTSPIAATTVKDAGTTALNNIINNKIVH